MKVFEGRFYYQIIFLIIYLLRYKKNNNIKIVSLMWELTGCLQLRLLYKSQKISTVLWIDEWFFDSGFLLWKFMQLDSTDFFFFKKNSALNILVYGYRRRLVGLFVLNEMPIFQTDFKSWFDTVKVFVGLPIAWGSPW